MTEASKMQKMMIERFLGIAGKRTFSDYAELVGLERTRVFRLFNGVEMKISEYEKFSMFVAKYTKSEKSDHSLYERMNEVLNPELQKKWEIEVQRKEELRNLLKAA